jgi:hypothetical protein
MAFKDRSAAEVELSSSRDHNGTSVAEASALRAIAYALFDVADAIRAAGERRSSGG